MLKIFRTKKFEKGIELAKKRGKNMDKLKAVLTHLVTQTPLPANNKDHHLRGKYVNCRECHIEPDWLLVYYIENDQLVLVSTGSHSDLF